MIKELCWAHPELMVREDMMGNTFYHRAMNFPADVCLSILKIFVKVAKAHGQEEGVYSMNNYKQRILHYACKKRSTELKVILYLMQDLSFGKYIDEKDGFTLSPRQYAMNSNETIAMYFENLEQEQENDDDDVHIYDDDNDDEDEAGGHVTCESLREVNLPWIEVTDVVSEKDVNEAAAS